MLVIRPGRILGKSPTEARDEVAAALAGKGYVVELIPDAVWTPDGWASTLLGEPPQRLTAGPQDRHRADK